MVYDVQNRRSSRRMLTAVSGRYSNTVTNTYDFAGRLKDESLTIATKTYTVSRTYDSLGRLFQMTYPNSTVIERTYTDRNQLYTVKYGSNIEDTRTYDDGGRLSTSTYRNGVTTTYNYRDVSGSKDNLLASIQFAHPGGTATNRQVGDLTYAWDANKNKTKETIAGTLSGYSFDTTLGTDPDGYDDEDRITYFKRSNTTNPQTWTLTSVGDWSSWKNFSTTAETRTHGAAHELTRIGSGTTPATILYDTKGNITQNQRTPGTSSTYQNYVWDFDNRMTSADTNGDNTADVTFEYDALGRRVARTQGATAVVYIHAGQQVVCDYTRGANANTTPAFRYVWGDYIDEPILRQTGSSTLLYYHHNQQYSTVALTSASGLVVTRYGYTAYGDQTILSHTGASQTYATYSNRISYTGREWDDSLKAHYFRARWYDATLGRFVNRDPIGYLDHDGLYWGDFGTSRLDPLGLFQCSECALGDCEYRNVIHELEYRLLIFAHKKAGAEFEFPLDVDKAIADWVEYLRELIRKKLMDLLGIPNIDDLLDLIKIPNQLEQRLDVVLQNFKTVHSVSVDLKIKVDFEYRYCYERGRASQFFGYDQFGWTSWHNKSSSKVELGNQAEIAIANVPLADFINDLLKPGGNGGAWVGKLLKQLKAKIEQTQQGNTIQDYVDGEVKRILTDVGCTKLNAR